MESKPGPADSKIKPSDVRPPNRFLVIFILALAGFAVLFVSFVVKGVFANIITQLDNSLYGQFLSTQARLAKGSAPVPTKVVIVGIDDATLKKLGAYNPQTYRGFHVRALSNLLEGKPEAVVYDILFTDPHPDPAVDKDLANQMKQGKVILAHYATDFDRTPEMLKAFAYPELKAPGSAIMEKGLFPMPEVIARAASGIGLANAYPDADGVLRKMPLFIRTKDGIFPCLTTEVFRQIWGVSKKDVFFSANTLKIGKRIINVDSKGRTRIPMLEDAFNIRNISFSDVYEKRIPPDFFKGKVVFVAGTAPGLGDNKLLPYFGYVPGVKIHANLFLAMQKGLCVREFTTTGYYLLVFAASLFYTFLFYNKKELSALHRIMSYVSNFSLISRVIDFSAGLPVIKNIHAWWQGMSKKNYGVRFFVLLFKQTRTLVETLLFHLVVLYVVLFMAFYFFKIYLPAFALLIQAALSYIIVREFKSVDTKLRSSEPRMENE